MPEPQGSRDWTLFLSDMQRFCARVLRNLELLGEAAKQIPDAVRDRHPAVPWRRIAGLRDVLAHAYFGLEDETIWQIVSSSVPALAAQLNAVASAEGLPMHEPSAEG